MFFNNSLYANETENPGKSTKKITLFTADKYWRAGSLYHCVAITGTFNLKKGTFSGKVETSIENAGNNTFLLQREIPFRATDWKDLIKKLRSKASLISGTDETLRKYTEDLLNFAELYDPETSKELENAA